jgi:hypothetical protein
LEITAMPDELVFYTNPQWRGRIVRWMLEEVGQPYRTELLDYGTTMKAPAYLAINPMGKVPAIRHGDTIVTEGRRSAPISRTHFPQRNSRRLPAIGAAALITVGCFSRQVPSRQPPATRRWVLSCRKAVSG